MYAIQIEEDQSLSWKPTQRPEVQPGEVLIKVSATAINRADIMQRKGLYPPPKHASSIMGLECAGVIETCGEGVSQWKQGDRVCALLAGGGYSQYVACPADHVLPAPANLSLTEAAALPEVFATAWLNIFMEAAIKENESVLLHAGASGVGTAAIQLCKHFQHPCFVTVGSNEKLEQCIQLGASGGSLRKQESFLDVLKEQAKAGIDIILDPVGGSYLSDNIKLLNQDGRLIIIGIMGGRNADLDLARVLMKRIRLQGSTLRSRSNADKARLISALSQKVWPLFETEQLKPVIHNIMPIQNAEEGHDVMTSNTTVGKLILTVDPEVA